MIVKKKEMFSFLLILLLVYIFSSNHLSADYTVYLSIYNSIGIIQNPSGVEPLYTLAMHLGDFFHLTYNQFLIFYSFCGLSLIYSTVSRYSKNSNWVLFAYICCPFFANVVQVRDFLATAIVIFSIRYLIDEDRNPIKFIIGILLASGFHKLSFVYLTFLLTFLDLKLLKKVTIVGLPIEFFLFTKSDIVRKLVLSLGDKYSGYFDNDGLNSMNFYNAILFSSFIIGTIIILYICYRYKDKKKYENYDEWMMKVGYISIFYIIAIVLLGNNFYRIFRNIIPLYYIAFSNISFKRNEKNTETLKLFKLSIYCYPLILFIFLHDFESVVIPILQSIGE